MDAHFMSDLKKIRVVNQKTGAAFVFEQMGEDDPYEVYLMKLHLGEDKVLATYGNVPTRGEPRSYRLRIFDQPTVAGLRGHVSCYTFSKEQLWQAFFEVIRKESGLSGEEVDRQIQEQL